MRLTSKPWAGELKKKHELSQKKAAMTAVHGFTGISLYGLSESTASAAFPPGMLKPSSNQVPRSTNLQRSEQKGLNGLSVL
jgi:hypothetical protein